MPRASYRPRFAGRTVVVLEDDPPTNYLYHLLLEREGFSLTCFTTNDACRRYLRAQTPDLMICDIFCDDEEDGLDVLQSLCLGWGAHQPAVIVATALADHQFRAHPVFERLHWAAVLHKPFDIDRLSDAVTGLLAAVPGRSLAVR